MAISAVGSAIVVGSTPNVSGVAGIAAGDLVVALAFRDVSTAAPSTPAGWTLEFNQAGNTCCTVMFSRIYQAGDANPVFTNATLVAVDVFRGASGLANETGGTSTQTTIVMGTQTFSGGTTSWVVGGVGQRRSTIHTYPSGYTRRQQLATGNPFISIADSNGVVSSFGTHTVTSDRNDASAWIQAEVLDATQAKTATDSFKLVDFDPGKVTFIGSTTTVESTAVSSSTINVPAGVQAGDLMFMTCLTTQAGRMTIPPTGASAVWSQLDFVLFQDVSSLFGVLDVFYRIATSSEPASYTFTKVAASEAVLGMNVLRNCNLGVLPPSAKKQFSASAFNVATAPAGMTVGVGDLILLLTGFYTPSAGSLSSPFTEEWDQSSGTPDFLLSGASDAQVISAGTTGAYSYTSSVSGSWGIIAFAIRVDPTKGTTRTQIDVSSGSTVDNTASDTAAESEGASVLLQTQLNAASDTATVSDSSLLAPDVNVVDALVLSDSSLSQLFLSRVDSASLSDTSSLLQALAAVASDSAAMGDVSSLLQFLPLFVTDALTAAEVSLTAASAARVDSVAFGEVSLPATTIPVVDSLAVSEVSALFSGFSAVASDSVGFTEVSLPSGLVVVVDSVTLDEVSHPKGTLTVSDNGAVSEVAVAAQSGLRLWQPSDLPSAPAAWLMADTLGLANGVSLTGAWPDSSGRGNDGTLVGTPGPKARTSALNGLSVVTFAFGEGRVRGNNGLSTAVGGANPTQNFTLVYLSRMVGPNQGRVFSGSYPPNNFLVGFHVSGFDACYDNGGGTDNGWTKQPVSAATPTAWKLYGVDATHDGTTYTLNFFIDTVLSGSQNGGGGLGPAYHLSGYNATGIEETCDCEVAEMIICPPVTAANRQRLEGYLAWKWGVQAQLPVGHPYKAAAPTIGVGDLDAVASETFTLVDVASLTQALSFAVNDALTVAEGRTLSASLSNVQDIGTISQMFELASSTTAAVTASDSSALGEVANAGPGIIDKIAAETVTLSELASLPGAVVFGTDIFRLNESHSIAGVLSALDTFFLGENVVIALPVVAVDSFVLTDVSALARGFFAVDGGVLTEGAAATLLAGVVGNVDVFTMTERAAGLIPSDVPQPVSSMRRYYVTKRGAAIRRIARR